MRPGEITSLAVASTTSDCRRRKIEGERAHQEYKRRPHGPRKEEQGTATLNGLTIHPRSSTTGLCEAIGARGQSDWPDVAIDGRDAYRDI